MMRRARATRISKDAWAPVLQNFRGGRQNPHSEQARAERWSLDFWVNLQRLHGRLRAALDRTRDREAAGDAVAVQIAACAGGEGRACLGVVALERKRIGVRRVERKVERPP